MRGRKKEAKEEEHIKLHKREEVIQGEQSLILNSFYF
jgi:hypothetical protein